MNNRIIPKTKLREFYEIFKDKNITGEDGKLNSARNLLNDHEGYELVKIFDESVNHFSLYENIQEGFHNRNENHKPKLQESDNGKTGRTILTEIFNSKFLSLRGEQKDVTFEYVDYEISPIRTTNAKLEENTSSNSSGIGGIDLLLSFNQTPYICEVKSSKDTDTFTALVQSITYASELITDNQIERLLKAYPSKFKKYKEIGVLLLIEEVNKNSKERLELLELTKKLALTFISKVSKLSNILIATVDDQDSSKANLLWNGKEFI
ncbi:hypothetical protein LPTSP4_09600 [Leptospira ryugenii]|uniref:Uncharacterized protein n=1 Tax=Leptospira ryugenii TaxID=1917863 RepID=A0A2P2DXT9_9LEPT|nr:hypothetical protein [Leptospira ryugenii]GBF49447.1 hypothetical protein LPTSP4_09600 [Leptospira ryugenii]